MTLIRISPRVWQDSETTLEFKWNGAHTVNVYRYGHEVTMLSSGDFGKAHATAGEVSDHIRRWLRENQREIDRGDYRHRPAHPKGRGERKGIQLRLTRRSGRRRYRSR